MNADRARWNEKYRAGQSHEAPNVRLIMHLGRLTAGRALDIACGPGDNASVLALAGWTVTACDISDEACLRARQRARDLRADLAIVQGDGLRLPFRDASFDLVVCTYYLERSIVSGIASLLRPGGVLFFESYTTGQLRYHPEFRREFCLEPGELRRMFHLQEMLYREEDDGRNARATLIARSS